MKQKAEVKVDHVLIQKICNFAGLQLDQEEIKFSSTIQSIIGWISNIIEIDTSNIKEVEKPVKHSITLFPDIVNKDVTKEQIMFLVPTKNEDFVVLPKLR